MRKWLIINVICLVSAMGFAQDQVAYIRQYQNLAIAEMQRTGIPASIKLAQALLESSCGKSDLACQANNHFGIKCGGTWDGKAYHKEDDDFENGKLVKSCFREFKSVQDSYIAHSDFLMDTGKSGRYGFLFDLDPLDYKGWAKGLSKAGYATDPQYANRLIEIIEKYELYRFDNEAENQLASITPPASSLHNLVRTINGVDYTASLKGDNLSIIANRSNIKVQKLIRYNDDMLTDDKALEAGTKVYLELKRPTYHGKQKYHMLKPGENMGDVAQLYGVQLDALLKRNGLEKHEAPLPKQKIMLKGKPKQPLKTVNASKPPAGNKPINTKSNPSTSEEVVHAGNNASMTTLASAGDTVKWSASGNTIGKPQHTVAKGETLYGIARTYGLSVDELKKKNNLSVDTIFVGQKLVWK